MSRHLALLALIAAQVPLRAQETAGFRGGPAHPGVYPGEAITSLPSVKWQFRHPARFLSSPTVAGNTVYIGSTDGNLYAIDVQTGTARWSFHTDARITSTPAVAGATVYIMSYDGTFYAVDTSTGKVRWTYHTLGERRYAGKHLHGFAPAAEVMPDPFDLYLSSPAVDDGTVYVGSGDGNVYALDAASGHERWRYRTGDVVHSSPAVADGRVFVGSWDRNMYALDAKRGTLLWRFQTGEDTVIHNQVGIQSSPTVVGGVVYFGSRDAHVYAVDARSGHERWAFATDGAWVIGTPVVHDGVLAVGTGDSELLLLLDAATGAKRSAVRLGWYLFASPIVVGRTVYIASWNGKLTAVDISAGTTLWEYQPQSSRDNLPAFTKPDGSMRLRPPGGEPFYDALVVALDRSFVMGSVLASPVFADGILYLASADGVLTALVRTRAR